MSTDGVSEQQIKEQYRTTLHQAYINNQMELDKTIIALSTAAIGFVYSMFQNGTLCWLTPFYWGALLCFLCSTLVVLWVFYLNGRWSELESLVETANLSTDELNTKKWERETVEKRAKCADWVVRISFAFGILFCVVLFLFQGATMTDKKNEKVSIIDKGTPSTERFTSDAFRPPKSEKTQENPATSTTEQKKETVENVSDKKKD